MIDDAEPAFPIFNIHVRVLDWVDLSKCDFSTDNGNYNKDRKPLWCDFFLDSEVQPNQELHSVRGLQKLNRKFTYSNLY